MHVSTLMARRFPTTSARILRQVIYLQRLLEISKPSPKFRILRHVAELAHESSLNQNANGTSILTALAKDRLDARQCA